MAECEPHVSSVSSGATLVSGEALVKLHGIAGKSSRSVVTTATVPTDVSECGDDDHDNSSAFVIETYDDSSDDESCDCGRIEKNSVTRPTKHVPPVQSVDLMVDLMSDDLLPEPTLQLVDTVLAEEVVHKPRSLPSIVDSSKKKKKDAKKKEKLASYTKRSKITKEPDDARMCKVNRAPSMKPVVPLRNDEIPESLLKAKRARRAAIRKWHSAPELGPERTVYDLYVPPHQTAAAAKKSKRKKKKKRERKTLAGAVGGMVAGAFIAGPLGVVLGAAAGGFCTRQAAKKGEKRAQRKREQRSFRDYATAKGLQWHMNGDAAVFC